MLLLSGIKALKCNPNSKKAALVVHQKFTTTDIAAVNAADRNGPISS
jgi:hypothetical protein